MFRDVGGEIELKTLTTFRPNILVAACLCAGILVQHVAAAETQGDAGKSGWQYSLAPYLWTPAFDGDIGVGPVSAPVDAAFTDYMDDLAGALLLMGEAKNDRTTFMVDGVWMRLKDDSGTPGAAFSMIDVQMDMVLLEGAVGYDIISNDSLQLMALVGVRYVDMTVDMDLTPDVAAVAVATEQVFDQTVDKVASKVQGAVNSAKDEIANTVQRSRIGTLVDEVENEIGDLRPNVDTTIKIQQIEERTLTIEAGQEQRDYAEALQNAIAERAADLVESELNPIERRNPDNVSKMISRAASESVDSLKNNVSSATRRELEKAEENLVAAVSEGVTELAGKDLSASRDWVDMFVGLRLKGKLSEKMFAVLYGDVGGFGIGSGSDLTWQAFAGLGWTVSETITVEAGYRHMSIDYDVDNLDLDLTLSGFVAGVGFHF